VIPELVLQLRVATDKSRVAEKSYSRTKKESCNSYRRASPKDSPLSTCRHPFAGWKNPIPGLKKKRFDSYTPPADLFLNTCFYRSSQEKNFPNTDDRRGSNNAQE
jgi:hypothetical protein